MEIISYHCRILEDIQGDLHDIPIQNYITWDMKGIQEAEYIHVHPGGSLYKVSRTLGARLSGLANNAMALEFRIFSLGLGKSVKVCSICGNLDPRIWSTKDNQPYATHVAYIKDVRRASVDCAACSVLLNGLSKLLGQLPEELALRLGGSDGSPLRIEGQIQDESNLEIYVDEGTCQLRFGFSATSPLN